MSGSRVGALWDLGRIVRFASVGAAGSVVDLSISGGLVYATGIPPEVVKFIGAECAIVLMFLVNDRWTFRGHRTAGVRQGLRRLLKSNLVRSGGIVIQVSVVFVLIRTGFEIAVADVDIWPILTMAIAIACGSVVNYVGETLITWRVRA